MSTKTTVNWWHQAAELNDRQSENLNGGSGFVSVSILGGLNSVEINKSDGVQVSLTAKHGTLRYSRYHNHHGYDDKFFF